MTFLLWTGSRLGKEEEEDKELLQYITVRVARTAYDCPVSRSGWSWIFFAFERMFATNGLWAIWVIYA